MGGVHYLGFDLMKLFLVKVKIIFRWLRVLVIILYLCDSVVSQKILHFSILGRKISSLFIPKKAQMVYSILTFQTK